MSEQVDGAERVRYWFPKPYADTVQRLRVLAGFLLLLAFLWFAKPVWSSLTAGLPLCIGGLLLRAWASGHLAKNMQLATSGPYAWMRNPLYAGTLVTAAGIVIASRSATLALIFGAVFFLVYLPAVELEEQHLRNLFPEYTDYARRVRRFLPVCRAPGDGKRFSRELYMRNQEYKAALGFALALLWLVWKCLRASNG
jgi:protein-S-isoprenylcysteine O-methyltransferase Ste14